MLNWLIVFKSEWKLATFTASVALFSIIFEAFGIGLLLPILQQLIGGELNGVFFDLIQTLFSFAEIEISVTNTLALLIIVTALKAFFTILREYLKSFIGYEFRRKMVASMSKKLFQEPYSNIIATPQGKLSNNILIETQNVAMGLRQCVEVLISISYVLILATVGLITNAALAAISALIALSFFIIVYISIRRFSREVGLKEVTLNQNLSGQVSEHISLNKEYRVSGRAIGAVDAVKKTAKALRDVQVKWEVATASLAPLVELLLALGLAAIILSSDFSSTPQLADLMGTLAVFMLVGLRLLQRCAKLTTAFLAVKKYGAALETVLPFLHKKEASSEKSVRFDGYVEFKDVDLYTREQEVVLEKVNLQISANTFVAFVGKSGSGKTTLVETMIGLRSDFQGSVSISGKMISEFHSSEIFRDVAVVSQELSLFNTSLRDNILCGNEVNEDKLVELIVELGLGELVERLDDGLDSDVGERGNLLSGGEKQRVLIARCLYSNASFLILDEPSSALDQQNEGQVYEILKKLKNDKTIVLVSHRPKLLELADHIYSVEDGSVKAMNLLQ